MEGDRRDHRGNGEDRDRGDRENTTSPPNLSALIHVGARAERALDRAHELGRRAVSVGGHPGPARRQRTPSISGGSSRRTFEAGTGAWAPGARGLTARLSGGNGTDPVSIS